MSDPDGSEVLSQSEVESILSSIQAGALEEQVQIVGAGGKGRTEGAHSVQPYDFRSPVFLTPAQMRRLRIKHEEIIRTLASTVSLSLRMEFALQMSRLETIPYQQLLEALPMPSHITLFRLMPMNAVCLFELAPRLGLTVLDRMMGGPGHSIKIEREFTDIEISVLVNFIKLVLKEYCESWLKYQKLDFEILEHENTARFLNIAEPDEVMLFLEMEARIGDCVAGMRLVMPYYIMEEFVRQLMAEISSEETEEERRIRLPKDMNSATYDIPVPVSAHLRGLTLTLRDVKNLEVGDVLAIDPKLVETVDLDLGNLPKFRGRMNRNNDNVRIEILSKNEESA